jgi:GNAT superfamily N-acetyltransferase
LADGYLVFRAENYSRRAGVVRLGRGMQIVQWTAGDGAGLKACHEVMLAVQRADDPLGQPPMSERVLRVLMEQPTEPAQTWSVPGDTPGTAKGVYYLRLPDLENLTMAALWLEVHPDHRRSGIGTALLRHAARQAAQAGRSVLMSGTNQGSAGEEFARRFGAVPGLAEARRVLVLDKLGPGKVAELRARAARAADGYSLVSWTGRTPEEYLAGFAAVHNAMADAPRDPSHEARVWTTETVRERIDDQLELFGRRVYSIAAMHDATGEMAALTQVEVDPAHPDWGFQQITAVARPHRGHRLGLLLKAAMLEWLATAEPQTERIVTWNAAVNEHMIAINEELGYELLNPQSQSYDLAVANVLGAEAPVSGVPGPA